MGPNNRSHHFYLGLSLLCFFSVQGAWSEDKPNIIVVMTDEHNFRTIGAYRALLEFEQAFPWGKKAVVETPNIDRLANEGVIFTNFYSVSPLCTPSRASFMTGIYPKKTGAWKNHGKLRKNKKTFANELSSTHRTAYLGKWHLDGITSATVTSDFVNDPNRKFGFEDTKYKYNRGHWKWYNQDAYSVNAFDWTYKQDFVDNQEEHYATDFLFDRAMEFIDEKSDEGEKFAIMLSIADPHAPNEVREPYNRLFKGKPFYLPKTGRKAMKNDPALPSWAHVDGYTPDKALENIYAWNNDEEMQVGLRNVLGMIKLVDDRLGDLLSLLDQKALAEDTIVVFTSDHGDMMGEHGRFNKGQPYKASAQVPMLMRWPGHIRAGKIINTAYSSVDFLPTIFGIMGIESEISSEGIDGSEEVLNLRQISDNVDQVRFLTDSKLKRWTAAITQQYKLVLSQDTPWFFDMEQDPDELINFYNDTAYVDIISKLKTELIQAVQEFKFPAKKKTIISDAPVCWDSKNLIEGWDNMLCSDMTKPEFSPACEWDMVRDTCPRVCNYCCEDSPGEIYLFGELRRCSDMQNEERFCEQNASQLFCPQSCGMCS